jgi:predicted nucleotide-binding protein (sugar kinase/HSP70/actin superfamily)
MKVTFPHMGYSTIAFDMLLKDLGHETIMPPRPSKRTLDLGVRYSPEFACIPFKMLTGTYFEVAEQGAEMVLTSGGVGPCRAGYYWVMHQKILDEAGIPLKVMAFEPPLFNIRDFWGKISFLRKSGKMKWHPFIHALQVTWEKLKAIDDLEMLSHELRPYEVNRGETTRRLWQALEYVDAANTAAQTASARQEGIDYLQAANLDKSRNPLRVGIIGEIYVVLEAAANHYLQIILGEMGVSTDRSIYLSSYTRNNTIINTEEDIREIARPYLDQAPIGGHGVNSIGETILYARHGFDGVVQLAPFSCIPEIVAKAILPRVSRELGIPVLTLFIDEQTGKAGVQTRLEAFVDLLEERRVKAQDQDRGRFAL